MSKHAPNHHLYKVGISIIIIISLQNASVPTATTSLTIWSKMPLFSQRRRNFTLMVLAIVVTGIWFTVAAILSIISVATPYWLETSIRIGTTSLRKYAVHGLWQIDCFLMLATCSDLSRVGSLLHAARAFSIAAAVMCLVSVPLALASYTTKRAIPILVAAAVALLQAASFATALILFAIKVLQDIDKALQGVNSYSTATKSRWSAEIGAVCTVMYFVGSLFFFITGIVINRIRQRDRAVHADLLSEHAEEVQYRQLSDFPAAK